MTIRIVCLTAALCVSAPALLLAQPPAGTPPAGGPPGAARAPYVPKNLKVLPDNTDLRTVMRSFEQALGVECEYCHAAAAPGQRPDRASDANPMKDTARYMIQMTDDLNSKYLAKVPLPDKHEGEAAPTVTCGTCHRGEHHPPAFVPPPRQPGNGPGGAPGMAPGMAPAPRPGM